MFNADDNPLTPEEISRKLTEFLNANFPGAATFTSFQRPPAPVQPQATEPPPPPKKFGDIFDFNLRPRDIKAHLDRFVIKQDEAKKALAIAVCDHYNHAKYIRRLQEEDPDQARQIELAKQNVIIIGPTGVGKTYLVKHIADLIGVPFVKADATKFSETGYVGGDVDDLIRELVQKANGDVSLAEYGIVYIDEIDKLATRGNLIGRDVSGRGVQTTLLKLMEETEVPLRNPMDIQGQMQAMMDLQRGKKSSEIINTRHILFVVSGAFSGLDKVISDRLRHGVIGFGAERKDMPSEEKIYHHASTKDFIEFGFEAEFIGRLPVRVICEPLSAEDLFLILRDSEGSLVHQYERDFEAYGIRARFEESALRAVAKLAEKESTGARGLLTVCEGLLRHFKFELPGSSVGELVIDSALVADPKATLEHCLRTAGRFANQQVVAEVSLFTRDFREKHGLQLEFTADALQSIEDLSRRDNVSALQLCKRLFRDYQFGLNLVSKNSGQRSFEIPSGAIAAPDQYLSELVVRSYQTSESSVDAPSI